MQNTSRKYKESMQGRIRNRGYIRVSIGTFNQKAQESVRVNKTEFPLLWVSDERSALEGITPTMIYATAEQDFAKVDGTMYFMPEEGSGYNIYNNGIISEDILSPICFDFGGGVFDIKGLTIDFGEYYPTEFVVETNTVTRQYSENKNRLFTTEDVFNDTSFFKIYPLSMVNGAGRLRIYRFACGLTTNFYNDGVKSFSYKEYVSPIGQTVPSDDTSITVFNYDMYYNPDNPESALAFMDTGQEIRVAFGYDLNGDGSNIEWLPEKKSYLKTWKANESEATFTSTDIFDTLGNSGIYTRGKYSETGISLYEIAEDVFNDLGVSDYFIDTSLRNILVQNPVPAVNHSSALQIIANAGRCVLKEARSGQIQIVASYMPDMWASANNEAYFSHVENILKNDAKDAYANGSEGFTTVDGSVLFIPAGKEELRNTGYISESVWIEVREKEVKNRLSFRLGNTPKKFPQGGYWLGEKPEITINIETTYTAFGLAINFRNNAPQKFHITAYHEDTPIKTLTVENPEINFRTDEAFVDIDKIVISFDKGYPNSRIFVDNVMVGDNTDYDLLRDRDLITAPVATRQKKIKCIQTKYNVYRKKSGSTTLITEKISVPENEYEHVATFRNPATSLSVTLSGAPSGVKAQIVDSSSYYARIKFTGITNMTTLSYTISGETYDVDELVYEKSYNESGDIVTWSNPLVSTREHAQTLEEWLSEFYLGDVEYSIDWKGDPAVDANDLFHLETKIGRSFVRAYENSLTFNGRWKGKMKARKVAR